MISTRPATTVDAPCKATVRAHLPMVAAMACCGLLHGATGDVSTVDEAAWTESVSRRRQRLQDAPQTVRVLAPTDLLVSPATELADRLRYEPGIDVYQVRHGQYDVGLRGLNGLNNHRILLLVDGFQLRQEEFGMVQWVGVLSPSDIGTVEIVKGPSSVVYGANAVGGVISVTGMKPGDRPTLRTVASVGSFGHREVDGTAAGPLGSAFYFKLNAGWSRRGDLPGVENPAPNHETAHSADSGHDDLLMGRYSGTLGWRLPEDHRLEVGYRANDQLRWDLVDDLDSGANDTHSFYDAGVLRLKGPWGEASHQVTFTRKAYQSQKPVFDPSKEYQFIQGGIRSREDWSRLHVAQQAGSHQLAVGGEYLRWFSRSNLWNGTGTFGDEASWGNLRLTSTGIYGEDQWQALSGLKLTLGLRGDQHSQAGRLASPRAAVNWNPSERTSFLASYSSGYRLPTPLEVGLQEFFFASDPSLQAERFHALEVAWTGQIEPRAIQASISGSATRLNHSILRLPLPASQMQANYMRWLNLPFGPDLTTQPGPFMAYSNLDNPAWVYGAEGSLRVQAPDRHWQWWTNATWQRLRYRDPVVLHSDGFPDPLTGSPLFQVHRDFGRNFNGPPEWKANLGATWDARSWFATGVLRAVDRRKVFSIGNSYLFRSQEPVVHTVPAYAALDLGLGLRFHGRDDRTAKLSVIDAFDRERSEWLKPEESILIADNEHQNTSTLGRRIVLEVMLAW